MTRFRQLRPQDVMFIGGELPNVYQHTAALMVLDCEDRPDFGFQQLRDFLELRLGQIPQYRWKLHEVPLGLDRPYWVEDENFSFDHHIRRIALPSPGDRQALVEVASYLYCKHLDRDRPLWEIWLIEGLADGQYALFQKQHHCMMDGEGATKLFDFMCDHEPDAPVRMLDPAIAGAQPGQVPDMWQQSFAAARHLYALPINAARELVGAAQSGIKKRLARGGKQRKKAPVPTVFFNTDIGKARGLIFGSIPLDDIKAVKNHFGVTVNEVILAVVSGSLREYLLARDALPAESLRSYIAISLRTEEDDAFSNKVTTKGVTLATALDDPVERLRKIAEETERVKKEAREGGGTGMMEIVQLLPPFLVGAMTSLLPPDRVAEMMGANVIVSSVRGSPEHIYIAGARVTAIYPMSVIQPGGTINITAGSYANHFDIGITIEPDIVPDPWMIIDGLHRTLDQYVALIGAKKTPGRKQRPASAKQKPKTKPKPKPKVKPRPKSKQTAVNRRS